MPPGELEILVDPAIAGVLALGALVLDGVDLGEERAWPDRATVHSMIRSAEERVRAEVASEAARAEFVKPARVLYKALGLDPTRHRPSCEQLMRRIVRGDPFPRVNPLVDAVNVCQLEERFPYGLYDLEALEPPVLARLGRAGESYAGIRKDDVHLEGRPGLFDARGPFGNPSSDSDRAKTTASTRRALVVVFGAPALADGQWEGILDRTARRILAVIPARVAGRRVVRREGS